MAPEAHLRSRDMDLWLMWSLDQLPDEGHDERWTPDGWTDVGFRQGMQFSETLQYVLANIWNST